MHGHSLLHSATESVLEAALKGRPAEMGFGNLSGDVLAFEHNIELFASGVKVKVVSNSLWPHGLYSLWNSPGQNTGVGSLSLVQGIYPTWGLSPDLLHCRQILYQLSHQGSPGRLKWVAFPFSSRSSQPRNWTGVSCIAGQWGTLLLLSHFSRVRLCVTPRMAAHQAPLSLGFSRQEHWSGLPFPSPMHASEKWKWRCSVVSDPQRPHGLQPSRLLHPWDFPGKSTGVGCHCLLPSGV